MTLKTIPRLGIERSEMQAANHLNCSGGKILILGACSGVFRILLFPPRISKTPHFQLLVPTVHSHHPLIQSSSSKAEAATKF